MKIINKLHTLLGLSLLSLTITSSQVSASANANANANAIAIPNSNGIVIPTPIGNIIINPDRTKPFDQNYWVTTHNAYEKINQNLAEMPRQLRDGVRGFMLDLYVDNKQRGANRIKVCHKGEPACYGPWANQLKNEFIPFLRNNPSEVVTLFLETYVGEADLQQVFDALPELATYSFNPKNFTTPGWPTMRAMAQNNNRLILLTDKREVARDYTVNGRTVTVLFDQDWIVQNHWSTLGAAASNIERAHNWSCPTRWNSLPLATQKVAERTGKQWNRLFLMNQFHTATSTTLDSGAYDNNLTYLMRRTANCGVKPHFIGINNYQNGDTLNYTRTLTEGGIYLWEGNNADKKQDTVCAIPAGHKTLKFPTQGCENDEARSMSISGMKAGTRITVYDNPDAHRNDDYAIIDIKRDIGFNEDIVIGSFERTQDNNSYQIVYVRNDGLDGKISRLEISNTPTDFSDAAIAMHEGNSATQNLDCTVPFNSVHRFRMSSGRFGCSNDEIRSATIIKAKAGTSFFVRGHPDGNDTQGKAEIIIKRDIRWPVVVGSFDRNFENADFQIIKRGKGVDGLISHGVFNGAQ